MPAQVDQESEALAVGHRPSDVELRLPADAAFVSVLRTTTAAIAARHDFSLDDIEDLRMSISEACAVLLPELVIDAPKQAAQRATQQAPNGSPRDLLVRYWLDSGQLTVSVTVRGLGDQGPDDGRPHTSTIAWQVLSALTTATLRHDEDSCEVVLTLRSTPPGAAEEVADEP